VDTPKKKLMKLFNVKVSMARAHLTLLDLILTTVSNSSMEMEAMLTAQSDQLPQYNTEIVRILRVASTTPGVQLYTGNYIKQCSGKDGALYQQRAGLCLETQNYPSSISAMQVNSQILQKDNASS